MAEMTLREFQATKRSAVNQDFEEFEDAPLFQGEGYLYLDDESPLHIARMNDGSFDLILGNQEYVATDERTLDRLERQLYVWAAHDERLTIPLAQLERFAEDAYPHNDDEDGSERQIEASNLFYYAAETRLTKELNDYWQSYSLKATTNEIIDEGLRLLHGGEPYARYL